MGAFLLHSGRSAVIMKVAKRQNMQQYIYTEVDAIMYDNGKIYLGLSGEERVELPSPCATGTA